MKNLLLFITVLALFNSCESDDSSSSAPDAEYFTGEWEITEKVRPTGENLLILCENNPLSVYGFFNGERMTSLQNTGKISEISVCGREETRLFYEYDNETKTLSYFKEDQTENIYKSEVIIIDSNTFTTVYIEGFTTLQTAVKNHITTYKKITK